MFLRLSLRIMKKILVIDDDQDICFLLNKFLSKHRFSVETAFSGKSGLTKYEEFKPDLVLCDFRLEDSDGLDVMKLLKTKQKSLPVIIMSGYAGIKNAVRSIKIGAFDYICKPLVTDEILKIINKALANAEDEKNAALQDVKKSSEQRDKRLNPVSRSIPDNKKYIFSKSPEIRKILSQIELVAATNYSVIIYGESGCGKEAIADEIHRKSNRADGPFVAIDCGSLSKELISSELFGHEKGAFTGAVSQKIGSFELADGGTIFLDEIANLSYDAQATLLRVIQERKIRRLGGVKDIPVNVRIVVASNERLNIAAQMGKFREDLFHRFNEFSFTIPPLRERREDVKFYADYFLALTNEELQKNVSGFQEQAIKVMEAYYWPGNLRELNNAVKRAALLCEGDYIQERHLPCEITQFVSVPLPSVKKESLVQQYAVSDKNEPEVLNVRSASIEAEFEVILQALQECNFNKSKAAKLLNIDRKTLYNKMKLYNYYHR